MVELTQEDLERRQVKELVTHLDLDELYQIDELVETHGKGLTLFIETDWYYDDCNITVRLERDRPETDSEYDKRIEKLKVHRAKQAVAAEKRRKTKEAKASAKLTEERKLYDKLKAKFETGGA